MSDEEKLTLEQQANMLLYNTPNVIEPGDEQEVFRLSGGGAPKKTAIVYREPKPDGYGIAVCSGCGKPRHSRAAGLCRACYREAALQKFHERAPGIEWILEGVGNIAYVGEADGGPAVDPGKGYRLTSRTNDFAPELIGLISRHEERLGRPICDWREADIDALALELELSDEQDELFPETKLYAARQAQTVRGKRILRGVRMDPKSKAFRGRKAA